MDEEMQALTAEPAESETADADEAESEAEGVEETTPETEMSEETTESESSEASPEEGGRLDKRIQQLTKKRKEAEERAAYWEGINKQTEELPTGEEGEQVTVEQIANAVINKQNAILAEQQKKEAAEAMGKDVADTIEAYPDLEKDDDTAKDIVAIAQARQISIKSAADRHFGLLKDKEDKAEKKVIAEKAQKVGVSSPQGGVVGSGETQAPDTSNMTEAEKEANWNQIISSY